MWIGADPGGLGAFGLAFLSAEGNVQTMCVSSASEALEAVEVRPEGVGIDAPLWWSAGKSSDRLADRWIRKTYGIAAGTVQAGNSLRGAALIQGALFVEGLRRKFPDTRCTEAHPKALLLATKLDQVAFFARFGIDHPTAVQHERDAVIAAIAAREGFSGSWPRDLSLDRLPEEQDTTTYWLAPMHYYWPE
jgi:hypothetical protein